MKITKEMVDAVEAGKCFSCGAMVYEGCKRLQAYPVNCARRYYGGTFEAMPDWDYTGKPAQWSNTDGN